MTFSNFGQRFPIVALACLFVAGCYAEPEDPEYGFGEADMQNAIVGDWSGMMSLQGQTPTAYTLSIKRTPSMQPACGNRSFSSPLCIETSSMSVEGTLSTADKVFDAEKLQGSFMVIGLNMNSGELSLSGTGVFMAGGIEMGKASHNLNISGDHTGSATLQR